MNDRGEDQFHRKAHLSAIHHDAGGAGHEGIVDHVQQVTEVDPPLLTSTLAEVDDHEAFIRGRDVPADERVGGVHGGNTLEVDVGLAELRADVIDVIRHPAQDRVDDRFSGITTLSVVAVDLLNPLKVCLLYTSPSPRDRQKSRMPSSA